MAVLSESIAQVFDMVLGVAIFIMFTLLVISYRASFADSVEGLSRCRESENRVVYEHPKRESDTGITRGELVSRMMAPLDYNIRIDGFLITVDEYHYLNYDYGMLPEGVFDVEYVYDAGGRLCEIRYTSR